jgi:hypothetical protein
MFPNMKYEIRLNNEQMFTSYLIGNISCPHYKHQSFNSTQ